MSISLGRVNCFGRLMWPRVILGAWLCGHTGTDAVTVSDLGIPGATISAALKPPSPRWHFAIASEDDSWPMETVRKRRKQLRGTAAYADELEGIMADDSPDTYLYRNYSDIKRKERAPSYFWEALCNGTKPVNLSNATDAPKPLDGWNIANGSCLLEDQLGDGHEYTDELKARMMCGNDCAAVVDIGCGRTAFRLCKTGFKIQSAANITSCLRWRLPDHKPYESLPRKPQEPEFWKMLCEHMHTPFHQLFRKHLCADGKTKSIPNASSELECAEASNNQSSGCADIFDFQVGPPAVCRCVPTGGTCDPVVIDGPGDVFIHG